MDDDLQRKLRPLRDRIDALDAQILDLLSQRARAAQEVGEVKHAAHADGPVLRPEREAEVIRRLQQLNPGPFPAAGVASVWTEIISACRGLERGMTVAYLGPQGSFSEQAALEHFGHAVQKLPCVSFDEVFRAVEAGQADVGMVPVENSTEGAVNRSLDLLLNTPLRILGERSLVIRHCLMSQSGKMDGIKTISAHPQALAQCQGWLTRNYPDLERVAAASNSEAARLAASDPAIAAIAGEVAAPAWNLQRQGQDQPDPGCPQPRRRRLRDAGAAGGQRRVDDALRIPPGPHRRVGILFLRRCPGTSQRSECRARPGYPAGAGRLPESAGFLPGAVSPP